MHHIRRDSGRLSLLIHGLGGNTDLFDTTVDALAAQREVIAIDLPGFGQTLVLDDEISIRTMSDAATQFLQAHGLTGIDAGRVPTRCARRLDQATTGDRPGPAAPRVLAEPCRAMLSLRFPDARLHGSEHCGHSRHWGSPEDAVRLILATAADPSGAVLSTVDGASADRRYMHKQI